MTLREEIAREIAKDVRRGEQLWPHYAELADRILALFQDRLDKVVSTDDLDDLQKQIAGEPPKVNLGHSISTGTRRD